MLTVRPEAFLVSSVMSRLRRMCWLLLACVVCLAAGCSRAPVNSPYERGAEASNTLFTAFSQRSPKYLDPASSYSADETPFTYSIYEPLYSYAYLARPYRLIPRAAQALSQPRYLDAQGTVLPADAPGESIAFSIYDIPIKPGILFQPHPAFARDPSGGYRYWPMPNKELDGVYSVMDFDETGTRELTAHDYVYAFRRLASPNVISPIFGVMAEHVAGMRD